MQGKDVNAQGGTDEMDIDEDSPEPDDEQGGAEIKNLRTIPITSEDTRLPLETERPDWLLELERLQRQILEDELEEELLKSFSHLILVIS